MEVKGVPLATEIGISLINCHWLADRCSVSQQLGALQTHTADTLLFISHTTNVLLYKFRCNIFNAGFGSEWDILYNITKDF